MPLTIAEAVVQESAGPVQLVPSLAVG